MPKKPTIKSAKNRAWKQFSRYIRTRDCLATSGFPDQGACCTCKLWFPFGELDAGHFVDGRSKFLLFDERGVHAQCRKCNGKKPYGLDGNPLEYLPFMLEKYGQGVVDEIKANKHRTGEWSIPELDEIHDKYKEKADALA